MGPFQPAHRTQHAGTGTNLFQGHGSSPPAHVACLKFSMGFPVWCRIQSIWQHGRRAKFVCRVVRVCISGAACRCALAAFVCPVARCTPRIYGSAIVDTALGMLAVDDCQALSRPARRRMRASLDYFYVRQLSSLNPPIPEANRLLRRSGAHLPWHTWQLPRRLECKAVLEICALVIQTIIRTICSLGFAYVFPVCWLCCPCTSSPRPSRLTQELSYWRSLSFPLPGLPGLPGPWRAGSGAILRARCFVRGDGRWVGEGRHASNAERAASKKRFRHVDSQQDKTE